MFWLPHEDTSVIVLGEAPAALSARTAQRLTLAADFGVGCDNETCFRHELGDGQHIQLIPHFIASKDDALVALIPLSLDGFDRLESVSRLLASLHGRAVPPDTRLTRQQRARFQRMLQSFDGYRAGATQQEIAQVVFKIDRHGRDEWQSSSTRHAIKSLLRDARAMIAGGYRKLLHHRRQTE